MARLWGWKIGHKITKVSHCDLVAVETCKFLKIDEGLAAEISTQLPMRIEGTGQLLWIVYTCPPFLPIFGSLGRNNGLLAKPLQTALIVTCKRVETTTVSNFFFYLSLQKYYICTENEVQSDLSSIKKYQIDCVAFCSTGLTDHATLNILFCTVPDFLKLGSYIFEKSDWLKNSVSTPVKTLFSSILEV